MNGLFDSRNDLSVFKDHIRDFLVQSKEFSAQVSLPLMLYPVPLKKRKILFSFFAWFIIAIIHDEYSLLPKKQKSALNPSVLQYLSTLLIL